MLRIYNSLTRKLEEFKPIKLPYVGIYSCGPTVYWNQHIGHMYAYVQWDILVRFLKYMGYKVKWVMNVTDVGHMTSEEDTGEDKMEKGAKREGISIWEVADKYIKQFIDSLDLSNINHPDVLSRATDHIKEQIDLIKKIEKNGFTYKTKMGVVFDTSKFPDYPKFANLKLEKMRKREDVEVDPEKKKPWDFFLWVTGRPNHIMQWESPWGRGYPGWHIECTAMSTKYLGDNFDIHTGGVDHINVHHTNEIAQGYAAFGKTTANYWLHNAHLAAKGGVKMSKSLGNFVTIQELVEKGYDPMALRYLFLTSHYRKGLNFERQALDASKNALANLRERLFGMRNSFRKSLSQEKNEKIEDFRKKFEKALSDDLNTPQALAVVWEVIKSNITDYDKYDLLMGFDAVLGLNLGKIQDSGFKIPSEVYELIKLREKLRKDGKFKEADEIRLKIGKAGFMIEDTTHGPKVSKS